jgi:hypothetical protein
MTLQYLQMKHEIKIWDFRDGDYEECRLLGFYAVWLLYEMTFRKNVSSPSSGWQEPAGWEP